MAEFYWPDRSAPQEPVPVPHIPLEGSGFDNLDIPEGEKAPKLHSGGFYPTAQLAADAAAESRTDGQQRLTTVTRQQNFLVPPRRHRAFPLSELL